MENMGIPIEGFAEFSRKVATEGAVLLRNNNQFLPLEENEKVAVFGRCQFDYYRSGTGSGGAVNVPYTTDFIKTLQSRNKVQINKQVFEAYSDWLQDNPFDDGGGGWAAEPWGQAEMPLDDTLLEQVAKASDKAMIIIGRTAGEDNDYKNEEGGF